MANFTTNYNLKKPLANENYNINDQNENMDLIDAALAGKETPAGAQSKADAALASAKTYTDQGLAAKISHSLATAANDFLVASGAGAFVKKTIAEVKSILGLGSAAYTNSNAYATAAQGTTADITSATVNTHLAENAQQFIAIAADIAGKVDIVPDKGLSTNDYDSDEKAKVAQIPTKADKFYVDTLAASIASGSPAGTYASLSALSAAIPAGNSNIYILLNNGHWAYWNGSAWTDGGDYLPAPDLLLQRKTVLTSANNIDDVLDLGIYQVNNASYPLNWPDDRSGTMLILRQTLDSVIYGIVQMIYINDGNIFSRYKTSSGFTAFRQIATTVETEKSLQRKTLLTSAYNIDDILDLGIYHVETSPPKPVNWPVTSGGVMCVLRQTNASDSISGIVQMIFATNGDIFTRYKTSSGFTAFRKNQQYGHPIDQNYTMLRNTLGKAFVPWQTVYTMPYMPSSGTAGEYPAGTNVPALPYSSVFHACNDILYNKTLSTFYSAVLNPASVLYTELGGTGASNRAGIYGVVCSTFVCYLCGQDIYYTTTELNDVLDFYDYTDICDIRIGDAMLKSGHVKMISDIFYDETGLITQVEIAEAWMPVARKTIYSASSFESQLEKYGGSFKIGRFSDYKSTTLEKIEYATDCIPNRGDKAIYKNGESIWLYVANSATTIHYKKTTDAEYMFVALSSLPSATVNGVTVYNITDLLSDPGTWSVTTSTANSVKATIFICETGSVIVDEDSFSVSGHSDNITPLWYQVMQLSPGTPNPYYYPSPVGYKATLVYGSKRTLASTTGDFEIPATAGYYIRIFYKTPYGQTYKDSEYVFTGGGGEGSPEED